MSMKNLKGIALEAALLCFLVGCATSSSVGSSGPGRIVALEDMGQFQAKVLQSSGKALVFFHSPKCPYCRQMLGTIKGSLSTYGSSAVIYTVNVKSATDIAAQYGVNSVPMTQFYRKGECVDTDRGIRLAFQLNRKIRRFFN